MRIRATKPEFWRSKVIASVDWEARFVLKGLESYVDDNGVGKDDIELIAADIFSRDLSRDSPGTLRRVSEAITALFEAGLVHRYEVDGTDLLYLSWWDTTQRINKPNKGRLPRPDGTFEYNESRIGRPIPGSPGMVGGTRVGTEEQRNRGTEDQTLFVDTSTEGPTPKVDEAPDGFDAFWDVYGKKRGKKASEAKWKVALRRPGVTAAMLIAAAEEYVTWERANNEGGHYIMDAARWLNGEHWNDERASRTEPSASQASSGGLPHWSQIEEPPEGLTDAEIARWALEQGRKRGDA